MIASAERLAKGGIGRVVGSRTLSKDQFLPAPTGTGERSLPFVSTVVKLEDRLRGVLESSDVLSHFECTG
jgi:chemotaxis signal transduction protein